MILNAYTVYDRKTLVYFTPFFSATDGAAIRTLSDLANDMQTTIGRHPADYVLFMVGMYNDANGELIAASPLRHVIDAAATVITPAQGPLFADLSEATADNVARLVKAGTGPRGNY